MNEKYYFSIVIPVYNNEKYIEDCVQSILNQDYSDLSKIQVILIDDGSTDNSLEVCNKLSKNIKEINIKVISGKNEGVSSARNKGIKNAEGKYIMFLDSDDYISKNAIRKLGEFFDEHYEEIDLLTYPIYNYDANTKKKKILARYKLLFGGTGVYDLREKYDLIQVTVNVVVKNMGEDNKLFNTDIFFHEDLKYNAEVMLRCQKIGYVKNVIYYYRMYGNSTTNIKENPIYTFEQFVRNFSELLDTCKDETGKSCKYVQSMILNIIRWRLEQDKLFPYNLEGTEWNEALMKIKDILSKIDNDVIMKDKQLDKYHKIYLIELKNQDLTIYNNWKGTFTINDTNNILLIENKIEIVVNRFKVIDDKICVVGYLKSPLLKYSQCDLYIEYVNRMGEVIEEKIEIADSTADYYKSNVKVAKFGKFEFKVDINVMKSFRFKVFIDENRMPISFYFNTWTPFDEKINNYKILHKEYSIEFNKKKYIFEIKRLNLKRKINIEKMEFKKFFKINKKIYIYRKLKIRNKTIWLYYDRKGIWDNAYVQFKHDIKMKDGVDRYYILDGDINNCHEKFNKEELKNVIKFGSFKHKVLYLNCDKILTSFSSLQEYCPFYQKYKYYKDILKYQLVYLQHGILHARLLKMYSKESTPIDKFVISSEFEKNNLINNYNYSEEDLIPVGMPRLDENANRNEVQNKIIFAPSWREYLIGKPVNRKRKIDKNKFLNSKYYREIISFLTDDKLKQILKDKDLTLDFKLHPIFKGYADCFENVKSENINISIGSVNLEEYKLFITDFSSFQFDFVRLNRPIIYFMPDMPEFKSGLHTYRELDLKYEDAFGKLCLTGKELCEELVNIINNDFKADDIYRKRMEEFFYNVENRKEKLYRLLKREQ